MASMMPTMMLLTTDVEMMDMEGMCFVWLRVTSAACAIAYTHHDNQHKQCWCFQHQSCQHRAANTDADNVETEEASQESITQEASFTECAILLMNNMAIAETVSNSSGILVSNQPPFLNKSTKKNQNT